MASANAYEGAADPVSAHRVPVGDAVRKVTPRRQFERLAFLLGLGGAAYLGYCVYRYLQRSRTPPPASELKNEETSKIAVNNAVSSKHSSKAEISNSGDGSESVADLENNNAGSAVSVTKVVLHQCPRGYYTPCIAPFPLKLETLLRVAGIAYEVDFSVSPDDGNVPWMTIGGQEIHESHECIAKLCEVFNINLDSKAQNSRQIACRLVGIMLDSHIYWGIALWRWVYDQGKSVPEIQPLSSAGLATIQDISSSVNRAAYYHGLGRLSSKQVTELILKDLGDLSSALGKHQYFLGEAPGEVDCAAFAMLAQMIWNMPGSPFEGGVKQYRNLVDFVLRMRDHFWPDWQELLQVRGQENLDGSAISPGSEFLHKRLLNSGSSQWDSKSASTITLKDMHTHEKTAPIANESLVAERAHLRNPDPAYTAEAQVQPKKSCHSGILKSVDGNGNNNAGLQKIVSASSSSKNPFEENQGNFPPAHVQTIPSGMIKPARNGPPSVSYSPAETVPHLYQNHSPNYVEDPTRPAYTYAHHPVNHEPLENMLNTVSGRQGGMPPSHGNVMQRIAEQNQSQRLGGIPSQNFNTNGIAPDQQLSNSRSGVGIYTTPQYQGDNFSAQQRDIQGNFQAIQRPAEPVYREDMNQPGNYYHVPQPPMQSNQFYPNQLPLPPQHYVNQPNPLHSMPYAQNVMPPNFREYSPQ